MTTPQQISTAAYDRMAAWYDKLAWLYSGGHIQASKQVELAHLAAGDRVLYLGVGSGEDAIEAARKGCDVTCIDLSQGMLDRVRKRLEQAELSAELVCGDALQHQPAAPYNAVVANYFLNCFVRGDMQVQLKNAADLLRPGGKLMIADVAPPEGSRLSKGVNLCYLKPSMALFWALSVVPWHENYAYEDFFAPSNLRLVNCYDFRLLMWGPPVFRTLVAEKTEPTCE